MSYHPSPSTKKRMARSTSLVGRDARFSSACWPRSIDSRCLKRDPELVVSISGVGRCRMVWRRRKLLRSFFSGNRIASVKKHYLGRGQSVLVTMWHETPSDPGKVSLIVLSDISDLPLAMTGRSLSFFRIGRMLKHRGIGLEQQRQ